MARDKDTGGDEPADATAVVPPPDGSGIRLSAHPRARRHIGMAKSWCGLIAFALVLYLSLRGGAPTSLAAGRAVAAGVIGYVAGWLIAMTVWRQIALAELEQLRRRLMQPPPDAEGDGQDGDGPAAPAPSGTPEATT